MYIYTYIYKHIYTFHIKQQELLYKTKSPDTHPPTKKTNHTPTHLESHAATYRNTQAPSHTSTHKDPPPGTTHPPLHAPKHPQGNLYQKIVTTRTDNESKATIPAQF